MPFSCDKCKEKCACFRTEQTNEDIMLRNEILVLHKYWPTLNNQEIAEMIYNQNEFSIKQDSLRKYVSRTLKRAEVVKKLNRKNQTKYSQTRDLPGRGPKKTVRTARQIDRIRKIGKNKGLSATQISRRSGFLGTRISTISVRRILKQDLGLKYYKISKKVKLDKPWHLPWRSGWAGHMGMAWGFQYPGRFFYYSRHVFFDWGSKTALTPSVKNSGTYAENAAEANSCTRKFRGKGDFCSEDSKEDAYIFGAVWKGGLIPSQSPGYVADAKNRWPELGVKTGAFYVKVFDYYIFPELKKIYEEQAVNFVWWDDNQSSHRSRMVLDHIRNKLESINATRQPCCSQSEMRRIYRFYNDGNIDLDYGKQATVLGDLSPMEEVFGQIGTELEKHKWNGKFGKRRVVNKIWKNFDTAEDTIARYPRKLKLIKDNNGNALTSRHFQSV